MTGSGYLLQSATRSQVKIETDEKVMILAMSAIHPSWAMAHARATPTVNVCANYQCIPCKQNTSNANMFCLASL